LAQRCHDHDDDAEIHLAVEEAHRRRHPAGAAVVSSAREADAQRELVAELRRELASLLAWVVADVKWTAPANATRLPNVLGEPLIDGEEKAISLELVRIAGNIGSAPLSVITKGILSPEGEIYDRALRGG
jgi:hypothetical protein